MDYLDNTLETLVYDILICWKWFGTNRNTHCDINVAFTCCVMDEKYNLQCFEIELHNKICMHESFFINSPTISHDLQVIHHYSVNIWEF